jgi:phosphoadenosine phosphosulfate reductase
MRHKSILVIGLDGATWKIINPLLKKGKLPFLSNFLKESINGISQSTLPPLTPSVWTTFLTGVNPGKHNIFGFLNYSKNKTATELYTSKDLKFRPVTHYLKHKYVSYGNLDGLIAEAGVESKNATIDELLESAKQKVADFKHRDRRNTYQFIFILFKEVDKAQHLFWGKKELEYFYQEMDKIMLDLVSHYSSTYAGEKNILILSDHGFHSQAKVQFSLYPWLVENKYIDLDTNASFLWTFTHGLNKTLKKVGFNSTHIELIKKIRNRVVDLASREAIEPIAKDIMVAFEGLYVDESINKRVLIEELKKIEYRGRKVFKLVKTSEQVYKGPFYNQGPQIVWIPNEDFHLNISPLEKNIFSRFETTIPGDHIADIDGIYSLKPSTRNFFKLKEGLSSKLTIFDLTSVVYDLLSIPKPLGLDGLSPIADFSKLDKKIAVAKKIIKESFVKYKGNLAIAFTGRKDSTVMMHIIRSVIKENKLEMPQAIFIDHGEHFDESIKFLKFITKKWDLDLKIIDARKYPGDNLASKKIYALDKIISEFRLKALVTAIRKDENVNRTNEKHFSLRKTHLRIHPILNFTESDIWEYIKRFNLDYNPLYDRGYRSLEERKTTLPVVDFSKPERSGRDKKKEKTMESLRKLGYF